MTAHSDPRSAVNNEVFVQADTILTLTTIIRRKFKSDSGKLDWVGNSMIPRAKLQRKDFPLFYGHYFTDPACRHQVAPPDFDWKTFCSSRQGLYEVFARRQLGRFRDLSCVPSNKPRAVSLFTAGSG
jgi:hypothetical protein